MESFQKSLEIGLATFFSIEDIPLILKHPHDPKTEDSLFPELMKCIIGQSKYTFAGLFFVTLLQTNGFIAKSKVTDYVAKSELLKQELIVHKTHTILLTINNFNALCHCCRISWELMGSCSIQPTQYRHYVTMSLSCQWSV